MTANWIADPQIQSIYGLTPGNTFEQEFSLVSFENILFNVLSFAIFLHEQIVAKNAENSRPHTIRWYREQVFNFLDGLPLVWINGQFGYDLTGVTDAEQRQIIDRAAVLESNDGQLVVKVATTNSGVLGPLSNAQLARFTTYMNLIKDAGNRIRIVNQSPDNLLLSLKVYVDPSIIDLSTGQLLTTTETNKPVENAINEYLANLEFNGAFVKEFLKNQLQTATGVKLPIIEACQWKFASFAFADFDEWKVPESGYFKIDPSDLNITYLAYDLASS
ncbi:MAG: hypothetical protein JST78_09520 [Bacteroidetes bacterium]|nr:hypothetical protein [Bacteroidota bacterium]